MATAAQNFPLHTSLRCKSRNICSTALRECESLLVAFSGGADSAYLAGPHTRLLAIARSPSPRSPPAFPNMIAIRPKLLCRSRACATNSSKHANSRIPCTSPTMPIAATTARTSFSTAWKLLAKERNFRAIAYGINADDTRDFRPGHRAAREHRILAPLLDAAWARPKSVSFRASRACPPGTVRLPRASPRAFLTAPPSHPKFSAKIEQAEAVLRELGFSQFRVRAHGELARIELAPGELSRGLQPAIAQQIAAQIKAAGFAFVTLDLEGYRQGSQFAPQAEVASHQPVMQISHTCPGTCASNFQGTLSQLGFASALRLPNNSFTVLPGIVPLWNCASSPVTRLCKLGGKGAKKYARISHRKRLVAPPGQSQEAELRARRGNHQARHSGKSHLHHPQRHCIGGSRQPRR